jgi:hypothetical protein
MSLGALTVADGRERSCVLGEAGDDSVKTPESLYLVLSEAARDGAGQDRHAGGAAGTANDFARRERALQEAKRDGAQQCRAPDAAELLEELECVLGSEG